MLFLHNFKVGPQLTNTFYDPSVLEARIAMLQRKEIKPLSLMEICGVYAFNNIDELLTCSVNASGIGKRYGGKN